MSLAELLARTDVAGFARPLRIEPTEDYFRRALGGDPCWSLVEDDGTLLAIIGCEPDADLILAALNAALDTRPTP